MRLSRAAVGAAVMAAVVRGPAGASARTADAWPWAHAFHVRLALHCPWLTTRPAKPLMQRWSAVSRLPGTSKAPEVPSV